MSRATVTITVVDGRHTAACQRCGWTYSNVVKTDVEMHKRWHRANGCETS